LIRRRKTMVKHLKTLIRDEEGASAVEYGLMVALIAAVIIVAVTAIGTNMSGKFTTVSGKLK
jgi:pilus assembly protein Flp/PilA